MLTPPDPHVVVLFGASGDLSKRKLLPGLFHLNRAGHLSDCRIVGTSLEPMTNAEFRTLAREACEQFGRGAVDEGDWARFERKLSWVDGSTGSVGLADAVAEAEADIGEECRRLHYLSVPPAAAPAVIKTLSEAGLVERSRVIMEKPFGTDLATAQRLNAMVHEVFTEEQVFRIDHFLGKEAALNILALRFANGLFEPIWSRNFIDHIQIDVPETLTVEGRGSFYDATGAFRDMVVTHLFQVLAFVAMEPPVELAPAAITVEKNKVFRSMKGIRPEDVVRGRYEGYRSEPGVAEGSGTETFIALKCRIDNWRWSGVPFYLRTGKAMAEGARIISIAFREPPKSMFPEGSGVGTKGPDHLTFDLDESSRVSLSYYGKRPGPGMLVDKLSMQFSLNEVETQGDTLEAYERLIRDAMGGDHTLFTTAEGIEELWNTAAPMLEDPPDSLIYERGSWGPKEVHNLIAPNRWRLPFQRRWRD
ncbi:MAG: glucose-6-phosphate dehydrogenase [Solirubrobacterales bacterium]|nr:glucose-6-phosphate dehydrogenase [Solirubrobacterales bacterium]